eukprot:91518-Amphidinium_carterae.1
MLAIMTQPPSADTGSSGTPTAFTFRHIKKMIEGIAVAQLTLTYTPWWGRRLTQPTFEHTPGGRHQLVTALLGGRAARPCYTTCSFDTCGTHSSLTVRSRAAQGNLSDVEHREL